MEIITLKGEQRKTRGTQRARDLRKSGRLPVIIYGHGEPPEGISLARHDVGVALHHGARILQVTVNGATKPYLIKEVQYDHLASTPIHIDLARVDLTERVKVRVGIELRGTPKGLSEGGVLEQALASMEVECLVTEIPDTLRPVITEMKVGDTLYVKDLVLPPGVTALADPSDRIATVKLFVEEAAAAPAVEVAAEAVPAEPERIGRIRKEEPEEGAEKEKK
ncbi:MAG: 50S ribosomal protein L25 [Planctomycetes bacterium]|nr:50S ribosomal protein L25 [Planctomycetota bacterium]MBI3833242.1 50S ribosomal protein L25 [Planctomycetota bacterium]